MFCTDCSVSCDVGFPLADPGRGACLLPEPTLFSDFLIKTMGFNDFLPCCLFKSPSSAELVVKVRVADSAVRHFVLVDLPSNDLTLTRLISNSSAALNLSVKVSAPPRPSGVLCTVEPQMSPIFKSFAFFTIIFALIPEA